MKKKEAKDFAQVSKNVMSNKNKKLLKVIEHGQKQKKDARDRLEQKAKTINRKWFCLLHCYAIYSTNASFAIVPAKLMIKYVLQLLLLWSYNNCINNGTQILSYVGPISENQNIQHRCLPVQHPQPTPANWQGSSLSQMEAGLEVDAACAVLIRVLVLYQKQQSLLRINQGRSREVSAPKR